MLTEINSHGFSKKKKVDVLNFPGATSTEILIKTDDVPDEKAGSIVIHVGTNDFTNYVNLPLKTKRIVSKTNRTSHNNALSSANVIFWKNRTNIEKTSANANSQLNNFCKQNNIILLSNDNIKEEYLGIKKLHLNRKSNSVFVKNLLNFKERNWDFSPSGDSYFEMTNVSNISTTIVPNARSNLKDIRNSNINR